MKHRRTAALWTLGLLAAAALTLAAPEAAAQLAPPTSPAGVHIAVAGESVGLAGGVKIMLMLVALAMAPSIVLSMTSFTRIIVVLALLRQAVGVAQLPPSRVLVGLALFLTLFTMAPVIRAIDDTAYTPYQQGRLDDRQALVEAAKPLRAFMLRHTREADLGLFLHVMGASRPATVDDVPIVAVVPAFMLSELKTAFQIGALLFIPFLVIDIVVAAVLMSMGMMMLPPATMSLPLKLIVFVVVDGWGLVVTSLANGFKG
ncbi:MAG: flagellar type III secretion system pore protein FliP [Deltaproteobacteria bacterium]|nr:flagellar type III secretion system pore protein FliP [Deltaproteobacteria bacterium]